MTTAEAMPEAETRRRNDVIAIPEFHSIGEITDDIRHLCQQRFGRPMTNREIWAKKYGPTISSGGVTLNTLGQVVSSHHVD